MKMKKNNLLILAVAALGFAACSSDETTAVNEKLAESNAISFRPNVGGNMRDANANGVKSAFESGDVISVYAEYNSSKYFQDNFTSNGTTFSSVKPYYWPADVATKNVTFTAIWGPSLATPGLTIGSTPGNFTNYTPDAAAANQDDILIAKHVSNSKENPVLMNFRHALSQIFVNVKNTNPNLKVTITGVRIGYIKTASTSFTYSGGATDTKDAANVAQSNWTLANYVTPGDGETYADKYKYEQTVTSTELIGNASDTNHDFTGGFTPWILLPQDMKAFDVDASSNKLYANAKTGGTAADKPDLSGSYIALQMKIENYNGTAAVGTIVDTQWCYWPITQNWTPGYKYTYTIDVAGGGYMPTDIEGDKILDPVLDGAVIVFDADCTIDTWTDFDGNNTEEGIQPINVPF